MDYIQELLLRQAALWMMRSVPDFSTISETSHRQTDAASTAAAPSMTVDPGTLSISPTAAAVDTLSVSPTAMAVDGLSLTAADAGTLSESPTASVSARSNPPDSTDGALRLDSWQAVTQALARRRLAVQQQAAQHRTTAAPTASAAAENVTETSGRQTAVNLALTQLSPADKLYLQQNPGSGPVDSVGMRFYQRAEDTLTFSRTTSTGAATSDVERQREIDGSPSISRSDTPVGSGGMTTAQRTQMSHLSQPAAAERRSRSSDVVETEVNVQTAGQSWDPVETSGAASALSLSIERDARRYDGGYRLY